MVFWGVKIKPKKPYFLRTEQYEGQKLHISQATLGLNGEPTERSIVKCKVGGGPDIFICSLNPGVVDSCALDLYFVEDVVFSVSGSAPVYLSGYYMNLDEREEDTEDEGPDEDSDGLADFVVDDECEEDASEDDESEEEESEEEEEEDLPRPSSVKIVDITNDVQLTKMEQKLLTGPTRGSKPSTRAEQEKHVADDAKKECEVVPSKRKSSPNEADKILKKKKKTTAASKDTLSPPAKNRSSKKKKKNKKNSPHKTDHRDDGEGNGTAGNPVQAKQGTSAKKSKSSKKLDLTSSGA